MGRWAVIWNIPGPLDEARFDGSPAPNRFATLFVALDAGYALCQMLADEAGRGVDYRFLEIDGLFEGLTGLADPVGRTALEFAPDIEPE